jgi:ferric-dicitrate binding protein FerR (iron transport regulator)
MTSPADIHHLDSLVSRILDGVQTPEDARALADLLATDDAALERYRLLMALHSSLHQAYASIAAQGAVAPSRSSCGPGRATAAAILVALAMATGLAGLVGFGSWGRPVADEQAAAAARPLALVAQTRFLDATASGVALEEGQSLESGPIEILGGAMALTLRNGVELVIEGPANLDLLGELKAVLRSGSVVVKMPKGMDGFRVETPTTEVLDLGTEFAVKVGRDALTDVQVFDGAVLAAARPGGIGGGFPRRLEAGEAARFSGDASRKPVDVPYDGERFIRRLPKDRGVEQQVPGPVNDGKTVREIVRQFGRPEHQSLAVSRPSGPVVIDGRLDEWADVPGFRSWLGGDRTAAESVEGRMMYDAERLYIAARVSDPAPLVNRINPELDPNDGWRGGGLQVRLSTDRAQGWPVNANAPNYYAMRSLQPEEAEKQAAESPKLAHLTMWYHAPSQRPCLTIQYGMMTGGLAVNPSGFEGAFARAEDGRGYILEYAIPWRLLHADLDPPQPGDVLGVNWQVMFSDKGGRLWRTQVLDVRNGAEPERIYTWERAATWGRAEYR